MIPVGLGAALAIIVSIVKAERARRQQTPRELARQLIAAQIAANRKAGRHPLEGITR